MLVQRAALILRLAAVFFFSTGVALLVRPDLGVTILGLNPTLGMNPTLGTSSTAASSQLLWSLRALGLSFFIPALLAPLVAAFVGERGLRQSAAGMAFICLGIGFWSLMAPGALAVGKIVVSVMGFALSASFFYVLRGRRRNR